MTRAFREGRLAKRAGKTPDQNPYLVKRPVSDGMGRDASIQHWRQGFEHEARLKREAG